MKLLFVGDVHWSQFSSILRKQGIKYSQRLENLIKSVNWVEDLSIKKGCDRIIYLGDFFDKPQLNDIEISALKEVVWNYSVPHDCIVGNHESSVNGLRYSSTKALESDFFSIIDKPMNSYIEDVQLTYLPYIIEDDRLPLDKYTKTLSGYKHIIISHNDIKGISFGPIESKVGFDIPNIESSCDLFINGHLHNGQKITNKIINLGNLSGQNFGEDAFSYKHNVMVLDTSTMTWEYIENPFAFNFYKIDIDNINNLTKLNTIKSNAVLTIKCLEPLVDKVKEELLKHDVCDYRIITTKDVETNSNNEVTLTLSSVDYLQKFTTFILDNIGSDDIIKEELSEVCK